MTDEVNKYDTSSVILLTFNTFTTTKQINQSLLQNSLKSKNMCFIWAFRGKLLSLCV